MNFEMTDNKFSNAIDDWMIDAICESKASPKEIYQRIKDSVAEHYYYFKEHASRSYELLSLLNEKEYNSLMGKINNPHDPEQQSENLTCDSNDESKECKKAWNDFWQETGMAPWSHSDLEYISTSNYYEQMKKDGWNMTDDGFWIKEDKKWMLPVNVDGLSGECYINLPDDLLEKANMKEGDEIQFIDRKDGSFEIRKVTKSLSMDEC